MKKTAIAMITAGMMSSTAFAVGLGGSAGLDLGVKVPSNVDLESETRLKGSLKKQIRAADSNNDGFITKAEAKGNAQLNNNFDAYDTSGDGRLSKKEIKAGMKASAKAEANGDEDKYG